MINPPHRIGRGLYFGAGALANHMIKQMNIDVNPVPPEVCPYCLDAATLPVRDSEGHWTWACIEGCNP
jgi:hypothetical protein